MGEALIVRRGGTEAAAAEQTQWIFDASGTFTVPRTGKYRIAAVGHGAAGGGYRGGSYHGTCGGAGYIVKGLYKGTQHAITISDTESKFADLITATAGTRPSYGNYGTSGTCSGDGVIPFESNGISNQMDIIPPAFWAHLASKGGKIGITTSDEVDFTPTTQSAGNGIFGGDGPNGGSAVTSVGSYNMQFYFNDSPAENGASAATPASYYYSSSSSNTKHWYAGRGGAGGYGGGGSDIVTYEYEDSDGDESYEVEGGTEGAAGCVFIEFLG